MPTYRTTLLGLPVLSRCFLLPHVARAEQSSLASSGATSDCSIAMQNDFAGNFRLYTAGARGEQAYPAARCFE